MANNLEHYRMKHGMTVKELCFRAHGNRNHSVIILHENGRLTPKAASKYAAVLNENVFDLLGEDALALIPRTLEEKQKLLDIVRNIKVDGE